MISGPSIADRGASTCSKNAGRLSDSPPLPLPAVKVTTLSGHTAGGGRVRLPLLQS